MLIDAGISGKKIENGLNEFDMTATDMHGILVTHEHIDHIAGLGVMARRYHMPIYATKATIGAIKCTKSVGNIDDELFHPIEAGEMCIRDRLGTLSVRAEKAGMDVAIISGDRDLLQLATDHVMVRIPKTKKTGTEIENYNTADVIEKYGVTPKEFIDVKALQGDTSDNIPGVPGIGEKTAGALIAKYHCIEAVHEDAENVKPPRASKNIVEYWEQALMSKELATIILDAPVDYEFSDAKLSRCV